MFVFVYFVSLFLNLGLIIQLSHGLCYFDMFVYLVRGYCNDAALVRAVMLHFLHVFCGGVLVFGFLVCMKTLVVGVFCHFARGNNIPLCPLIAQITTARLDREVILWRFLAIVGSVE